MALNFIGRRLARFLSKPVGRMVRPATSPPDLLANTLRRGDVLLVEGNTRISSAIKYLTQSTWSHAALYVGDSLLKKTEDGEPHVFVEADVNEGVRSMPLSTYASVHNRICRPVGVSNAEIDRVVGYVVARIGYQYDLQNVFDLARYLIQKPPVPDEWRRRLIAFGSGDPTRAICSSLIAGAFQSIRYPILPEIEQAAIDDPDCIGCHKEILHIRHHSLYTPRDFDLSPYFKIVKPTLENKFDFHGLTWSEETPLNF
jgi:hypothetical protein